MSKPKYRWWSYALNVAEDLHFFYSAENVDQDDDTDHLALLSAIEETKKDVDGTTRLALIFYIYGNTEKRTIKDAAAHVGISENTAKKWHGDFVRMVGECLGFSL